MLIWFLPVFLIFLMIGLPVFFGLLAAPGILLFLSDLNAGAPDPTKQLKRAEIWLAKHGDDPDLLLAAARLCLRNELWGKARSYLETVISLRPTAEAYQEYGRLLNQLGETDAAAEAFREGLGLVAATAALDVPRLESDRA